MDSGDYDYETKRIQNVKLCKLPKILPGMHPPVPEDWAEVEVLGIAHDSRRVKPGSVFVAIPGHERDGNDYVADALARGADDIPAVERVAELRDAGTQSGRQVVVAGDGHRHTGRQPQPLGGGVGQPANRLTERQHLRHVFGLETRQCQ